MKIHQNIPQPLVESWFSGTRWDLSLQTPPIPKVVKRGGFHYHDVEEWLQVTSGMVTFFSAGEKPYPLGVGDVLQIPRGEAHDVKIGAAGVEYKMWVPVTPTPWEHDLTDEDMDLIRKNLEVPKNENVGAVQFFKALLSDGLTFYGADGTVLDNTGFFGRGFVDRGRSTSGSVQVLNKTPDSLLLSTVVTLAAVGEKPPQSFTNVRLFVREAGELKCRVWVNYREPG